MARSSKPLTGEPPAGEPLTGAREAILDGAFRRFAHYGYRRTSLHDIAEESGLSRPALYYYFRNKEDVFRALVERINRGVVETVTKAA